MQGPRWTAGRIAGVLLIVAGVSGAAWTLTPRADSVPSVPIEKLGLAVDHAARSEVIAAALPKFRLVGDAAADDNTKKNVRLWDAVIQLRGEHLPNVPQEIGDCVSFGAANAVNYLQAVQIVRGLPADEELHPAYQPWIYGVSRVDVGAKHGSHFRGDGSVGAYAAEGLNQYGCLRSDYDNVPPYSGAIAKEWGDKGPPQWAKDAAKPYLVQTVAQVKSAAEVRDAICNGFPVTIASGWWGTTDIPVVNGRRVARRTQSWGHQQCLLAYDGSQKGEPLFYCLNSWGPKAHPDPMQGEPPGGYWIRSSDVDRICKEGDSWAFSAFDGFPAKGPNWDDLLRRPVTASAPSVSGVNEGGSIMSASVGLLVLCALAVLAGACLIKGRQKAKSGFVPWMLAVLLCASVANAEDFGAAMRREVQSDGWHIASERPVEALPWETAEQRQVVGAVRKFRNVMFSPSWCSVCVTNDWLLASSSHDRAQYERIKGDKATGDEAAFPYDVRAMGESGWPVWKIECADGVWRFANGAKSYADLCAFHDANGVYAKIPASTYWQAIGERMPRFNSTVVSQFPAKVR